MCGWKIGQNTLGLRLDYCLFPTKRDSETICLLKSEDRHAAGAGYRGIARWAAMDRSILDRVCVTGPCDIRGREACRRRREGQFLRPISVAIATAIGSCCQIQKERRRRQAGCNSEASVQSEGRAARVRLGRIGGRSKHRACVDREFHRRRHSRLSEVLEGSADDELAELALRLRDALGDN